MSIPLLVGIVVAGCVLLAALILIAVLLARKQRQQAPAPLPPAPLPQSPPAPTGTTADGPPTQPGGWASPGLAASRNAAPPPQYNGPPRYSTPAHGTPVSFRAIGAGELVLLRGEADPEVHDLSLPAVRIGRSAQGNHVVVHDPMVSGAHAEIRAQGGGHTIQDLRSTNGTYVNGGRIAKPYPLSHGDRITLGNSEWVYRHGEG